VHPPRLPPDPAPLTIIYLPTGPIFDFDKGASPDAESGIIAALSEASNATIVRVDYRLGDSVTYPAPVHQVLAAYDWVKGHLVASEVSSSRHGRHKKKIAKLGVCGQLLGGSLATMLALTESRIGETRIAALAAHNPVLDWIFPEPEQVVDESDHDGEFGDLVEDGAPPPKKTKSRGRKKKKLSSWELYGSKPTLPASSLLNLRSTIFRKPANYFDPFASPILFFRSPGADVPVDPLSLTTDDPLPAELQGRPTRRRKVHRVFPPTGSTLKLPRTLLSFDRNSVLSDQNDEMVRLMRRAVMRKYLASLDVEGTDADWRTSMATANAEERIEAWVHEGPLQVWGNDAEDAREWRQDVEEVGSWMRQALLSS
jgi:acetyl esterase/lipase